MLVADAKAGRGRTFLAMASAWKHVPVVDLPAELYPILAAHASLGVDGNGTPLLSERAIFFERAGMSPGLEDAVDEFFDVLDLEMAVIRKEQLAKAKERD